MVEYELDMTPGSSGLDAVEPQLQLWLDGQYQDGIQHDMANLVSQWENRSDNANDAIQNNDDQKPTYVADEQMMLFDGNHSFVVTDQMVDIDTTYFVIYKGANPVGTLFAKSNPEGVWTPQVVKHFLLKHKILNRCGVGWLC